MKENVCGTCAYFIQHYALDKKSIYKVFCGHCHFGRLRRKTPDASPCENYVKGEPDVNAFARKEYISKELLQYLLHLELLPEIKDGEDYPHCP